MIAARIAGVTLIARGSPVQNRILRYVFIRELTKNNDQDSDDNHPFMAFSNCGFSLSALYHIKVANAR